MQALPNVATKHALDEIHIGCSGWFYWGWRGKFYPLTVRTDRWFPYYAKHFKTVELNAPFYSWPKRATVQGWIRQAPKNFLYSIKVNRFITHDFRMEGTAMLVEQFYLDVGVPLGERMACFLFQFPPSFRYTKRRLDAICRQLDPRYRNVVEFRHKSWWNGDVYKALRKRKIIMCAVSAPRIPDKLVRTADDIYVRLHGTTRWYRHDYSDAELRAWAEKILSSGARRAWIYFDNDRDAHAIKNAKTLRGMLKSAVKGEQRTPSSRYSGERAGERGKVRVECHPVRVSDPRNPGNQATPVVSGRSPLSATLSPEYREEGVKASVVTPASASSARSRTSTRRNTDSDRRSRPRRVESRRARSGATASAG